MPVTALPTGTVTFLRTDVEGSMRLAAALGAQWDDLNAAQLGIIRDAVEGHGGRIVRTEGDAVFGAFGDAGRAVATAIAVQRGLADHAWPEGAAVRARIGLHSGEAHLAGDDYGGFDVNRAARIAGVGHGGQIVLSDPTRALVAAALPPGVKVRDLGRHNLRDVPLPEQLFQLDVPGLTTDFPPLRTAATIAGNLPPRLTSFLGRERELEETRRLIAAGRLLTIVGPGGIGKTSLALELARDYGTTTDGGAWFVALDVIDNASHVPGALARVLGIHEGPGRPVADAIARHLAERPSLLVLDNFEHVLAAAPFVGRLLREAPPIRVVVTSRAPLRIEGEQEYAVGPLAVGAEAERGSPPAPITDLDEPPAVRLFVERAGAARPGWTPGAEIDLVREICHRLDGLPLGIEIAAARVALLPLATIRGRLAARLPLPGSGRRDAPDRQRTLENAIAWSVDLLGPDERRALRSLAVFEGGFDLEQAAAVAFEDGRLDPLETVLELVEQNLLAPATPPDTGSRIGGLRFRMLELIRSFALRELEARDEADGARRRHAAAFLDLAETAARRIPGGEQPRWLDRLAEDHGNLTAAVEFSIDHGPVETAERLGAALWRYWQFSGRLHEGRRLIDRVIELRPDEASPSRMWAVAAAAGIAYWQAETDRAHRLYGEQLTLSRQIGDPVGEADATYSLSATEFIIGDREHARELIFEARRLYERTDDAVGAARTLWAEHNALAYLGRYEEALPVLLTAERLYEENGDVMYQALAAGARAFISILTGAPAEAARHGGRSLEMAVALRDTATATITLAASAILVLEFGRWSEAATLLGAYEHLSDVFGVRPPAGLGFLIELFRPTERVIERLHAEEFSEATERGRAMSYEEAISYAFEVVDVVRRDPGPGSGQARPAG